jgi:hypothetical protein
MMYFVILFMVLPSVIENQEKLSQGLLLYEAPVM